MEDVAQFLAVVVANLIDVVIHAPFWEVAAGLVILTVSSLVISAASEEYGTSVRVLMFAALGLMALAAMLSYSIAA
jgi:hypothetical protein